MKNGIIVFLLCVFFNGNCWAQDYDVAIFPKVDDVTVDGRLTEATWLKAKKYGNFYQHYPYDTSLAKTQTEFMLSSDEENIYFAFICYNNKPEKDFVLQSLKRDFSINTSDAIVLTISPFLDGQNGFSFGVTPENSQREGAIENGGNFGVTTAWDQIWYSATYQQRDTWFAEFKIPFKSIRFAEGNTKWKFNIARADYKNNEVSSWVMVPRNFNVSVLSFSGNILWNKAPIRKGKNIAIIPYTSTVFSGIGPYKSTTDNKLSVFQKSQPRVGFDAKIGLSSSLNLDITVNPDFAQVEVDEQQINLTRFSLFFPERRQFFIENSDLFAGFGFRQIRPFFSRRIGLGTVGNIPLDAGIRLTGKISNQWRVGAMVAQTRGIGFLDSGSINYSVVALQRKVFAASNVGFILVNNMDGWSRNFGKDQNTVTGLEYNLQSKDAKWVGKAFVQKSINNLKGKDNWSHATFLDYRTIHWDIMWNHEYVGRDFVAKTGFVPRVENFNQLTKKVQRFAYWRLEPQIVRTFYPKISGINNYSFSLYNSSYYDSVGNLTECYSSFTGKILSQKTAEIRASVVHNYADLYVPFTPISNSGIYLLNKYRWINGSIGFTSNNRKKLNGTLDLLFGNYYTGTRQALSGNIYYRVQPWAVFSVTYRHEDINLGAAGKSNLDLLGAKADISFTTTMYLTAFLQYNTQAENVNINIRYQWRFRPLSDFFIVYSENYLPENFNTKNRSLALKLLYWFNT